MINFVTFSPRGLFISTSVSTNDMLSTLYGAKENDTFAPVVFNQAISDVELTDGVGKAIEDLIVDFRSVNDNNIQTNGYAVSSRLYLFLEA